MSDRKGLLKMCDRCHATVFLETIGNGETDGGFTRWNKFEPAPKGWTYNCDLQKTLCPECSQIYQKLFTQLISQFLCDDCSADIKEDVHD